MALPAEDAPATDPRLRARLERALTALPAGYRAVLVLHDVEGLQHEEIARDPRLPRRHVEVAAAQGARQDARAARRCAVSRCDVALLSALVDGDLPARKATRVRAHVDGLFELRAGRSPISRR